MRAWALLLAAAALAPPLAAGEDSPSHPSKARGEPAPGRPLYGADRTQSPIPADVAERLRRVAAASSGRLPVFAKVGDSVSYGGLRGPFLGCFDPASGARVNVGGRAELARAIDFYLSVPAGSVSSFARDSLAVEVGRNAAWAAGGSPSPVEREVEATRPAAAVVMFGSNDVQCYGCGLPDWEMASIYFGNMRRIADLLLAKGVVPILSSAPPRTDDPANLRRTPIFANAVRALAQGRLLPFLDYEREMERLPALGLGPDGIHPSFCPSGVGSACRLDEGTCGGRRFLEYGYNVRNLVTLEALSRLKAVLSGERELDPDPPRLSGQGTWAAPFAIPSLPFTDLRDPRREGVSSAKAYGCRGAPKAPGPEVVYRLALSRPTALRIAVLDGTSRMDGPAHLAVYLLGSASPRACQKAGERSVAATLPAGTYHLAVDSLSPAGGGEYALVVLECAAGDRSCR